MKAFNKSTGLPIVGILESVLATYPVNPTGRNEVTGELQFGYTGEAATAHWDTADPVKRSGMLVFVDEDGEECLENEVEFKEES